MALPLRQGVATGGSSVPVSPLWGACVLWRAVVAVFRSGLCVRLFRCVLGCGFGQSLRQSAIAKPAQCPPLYAVARTCHFAAFLSPFPPLHTAPCPPCPTAPGRCVPYTPPPTFRTRAASATFSLVQRSSELRSAHF